MTDYYGSITNPATLADALHWERIGPADTVYLRAGTYALPQWVNRLQGTAENRITVKPYNNEVVTISGGWGDAQSSYVDYVDLEFTTTRDPAEAYTQAKTHDFSGTGNRVINCTLHDSHGGGCWDNVDLFYGTITYNHGTVHPVNGGHGHSLYTQNQDASHKKTVKHSVFGPSANYGLHGFSTNFPLANLDIIECVLLPGSTHLIGSQRADHDITYSGSHSSGLVQFGYWDNDHASLTLTGNRMYREAGPLVLHRWASGTITGNTLVSGVDGGADQDMLRYQPPVGATTLTMNNNTYFSRSGKELCIATDGIPPFWMNLATWNELYGFDANSTITLDGSSPANSAHVYPNEYAAVSKRKGLVVIWNWSGAETVDVDLTDIPINANASMKVVNCEDPLTDVVSTTMPADKVYSFPMTGHTVAQVTGWAARPSAFPTLGAFMIEI